MASIFPGIRFGGSLLKGPSADGTNGQVMETDGSGNLSFGDKGSGGGGLTQTAVKTAAYTASAGEHVLVDSANAAGDFAVSLPGTPSAGDRVRVTVVTDDASNTVTIDRNTNNVNGGTDTEHWRLVLEGDSVEFEFVSNDAGWAVTDDAIAPHIARIKLATTESGGAVASTWSQVPYDTTLRDKGGIADLANDRVSIRRGGDYFLTAGVGIIDVDDGSRVKQRIDVGGTRIADSPSFYNHTGSATGITAGVSGQHGFPSAGDAIISQVFQDSSTNKDINGDASLNPTYLDVEEVR